MAAYHAACLAELVEHVGRAIDSFRAGELDAFAADRVLFQYSRWARELSGGASVSFDEGLHGLTVDAVRFVGG